MGTVKGIVERLGVTRDPIDKSSLSKQQNKEISEKYSPSYGSTKLSREYGISSTGTLKVLKENKNSLTKLAQELLNKEVIFKEDLETIFGNRQWDKDEKVTLNPSKADKKVEVKEQALKNEEKPV